VRTKGSDEFGPCSVGDQGVIYVLQTMAKSISPRTRQKDWNRGPAGATSRFDDPRRSPPGPWAKMVDVPELPLAGHATVFVNRYWGYLLGRGPWSIPIDDLRETNPPSKPRVARTLWPNAFIASEYDLKSTAATES